jgi:sec-independent protein translocase protein TatB
MFDIAWTEMLVIAIVLIVVVGPKDLPRMLRSFGRTTNKLRSMAGDFRKQFDEALKEAELDEVKNLAAEARKLDPTAEIRRNLDPMRKMGDEIRAGLEGALKSKPPVAATGTAPAAAAVAATASSSGEPTAAATPPVPEATSPAETSPAPASAETAKSTKSGASS